jgi:hypothetical protein
MFRTDELRTSGWWLRGAAMLTLFASGCGSASQTVTGPSSTKCAVSATAETASFPPAGGTGQVMVTTNRECPWTATTASPWIQLNGTTSGQGQARLWFAVVPNADPAVRQGTITVADQQVAITQQAATCTFSVEPAQGQVPPAGGRGTVHVKASSRLCAWTARSDAGWLSIVEGTQGTGDGQVVYEAQPTSGPPRSGTLTIAGQSVPVGQGDGCSTTLTPTARAVPAAGEATAVTVAAGEGCTWTASSGIPWITVAAGASGSGNGEVRLSVAVNTGPERHATVSIAGHPFPITQASGCHVTIGSTSQTFPPAGGSGTIAVSADTGCTWRVSGNPSWVSITGAADGSGAGEVRFSVVDNSGPERRATLNIGGRTFSITQADGCRITVNPAGQAFAAAGGTGTASVTAGAGCPWTASSSVPWAQVTAGQTGTGPGTVTMAVAAHEGPARQGSLSIGGQTFTIQQESGCRLTFSAPGTFFGPAGGGGTAFVQIADGCSWTASIAEPWAHITAADSGTGPGAVHFVVSPNTGPERSVALTAGGQNYFIRQTGPGD